MFVLQLRPDPDYSPLASKTLMSPGSPESAKHILDSLDVKGSTGGSWARA